MKTKNTNPKRITTATIKRKQYITDEIAVILHKEAHTILTAFIEREDSLTKRLNAMEREGVPTNTLDEIMKKISALHYNQVKLIKANEQLLSFFNITKDFLNSKEGDNH